MATQFHLADLFETIALTVPDRVAVISDSLSLTYAELNDRTNCLASGLAAHGIVRGDTVGLYMMNRAEHLEAFIATIKLGAVPFNVNFRYRSDELRYLFTNAQAAAIIHSAEFGDMVQTLRPDLPDLKISVAVADGSAGDTSGSVAYNDLLKAAYTGPWPRSESDILLTYTGGTTGMPKGVMWPHRAFFFACAGAGGYFNPHGPAIEPGDIADRAATGYSLKMFPVAPLMHAAALWAVWSCILNGLTIVLDESANFDPIRIWDKTARLGINMVQIVGDAMAIPLRDALRDNPGRWDVSTMVNFGSGGAIFSRHVKDDIKAMLPPSATITDGMGSSETGTSGMAEASAEGMMRLPSNAQQRVVVDGRFAAVGETGFVARTGNTPVGYFGDPEKSAEVFCMIDGQLWAISGDTARLDPDNMVTVFGRGSTCINSGGEKIFPEEVEEVLRAHPAVRDAVVAGQADPRWGER
ncbi:MAG: hypothetical protein RLZZ136_1402, partial [Pseudomonadota bacterium]